MPGRRLSSVMSRLTGAANTRTSEASGGTGAYDGDEGVDPRGVPSLCPTIPDKSTEVPPSMPVVLLKPRQAQPAQAARAREPAGGRVHLRRRQLLGRADRLVHRGLDHVLEHLDVLGIDRVRVDRQLLQLQLAADLHRHHAAAGAGLHDLVLQLLLSLRHVGLHLLDLLHHLVQVGLTHQSFSSSCGVSKTSSAPNSARSRSISWSWSSVAGPGGGATASLSSKASVSGCPVIPRTAFATRSRPCSAFFLTNAASAGKAIVRRSASSAVGVAAESAALSIPLSSATASATAGQRTTICSSSTDPAGCGCDCACGCG